MQRLPSLVGTGSMTEVILLKHSLLSLSSGLATTALVMTVQRTAPWTRSTTGTSRTTLSPVCATTWVHEAGGARMRSGPGGSSLVSWSWRPSRRPRGGWSPSLTCSSQTCIRKWLPTWRSREMPCGGTFSSTRSITLLTCTTNNVVGQSMELGDWCAGWNTVVIMGVCVCVCVL